MTKMRKRRALNDYGRANLRLRAEPIPDPGPSDVLDKVAAVSLHRDVMMIANGMGSPLDFPFSPGWDMAGKIVTLGAKPSRRAEPDRRPLHGPFNFVPSFPRAPLGARGT